MKLLWLATACLWLWLFAAAGAETVRVATYNLRNYLMEDRMVDGVYRQEYPKPEYEKEALRAVIHEAGADILAIQEIGGPDFLEELQRDLARDGLEYPHAAILLGPDTKRRVAALSKLPFQQVLTHDNLLFTYFGERISPKRGLLELTFRTGGTEWTLFVVHLKSRWTVRDDDRNAYRQRTGEAEAMRNYIRERFPAGGDGRYLVAGDFNDTLPSAPLRRFLSVGGRELTQPLPARDSRGEYWTYFYRRHFRYERVDFILASLAMLAHVKEDTAAIVDLPVSLTASDHRLVYVDLQF